MEKYVMNAPTYEHTYSKDELVMWDDTQVMHKALGGHGKHPRLLYRG